LAMVLASSSAVMASNPLTAFIGSSLAFVGSSLLRSWDYFVFMLGEALMWNPMAKVFMLVFISLVFIAIGAMLFQTLDPGKEEIEFPVWSAVRGIVNPFEDDVEKVSLRLVSVFIASMGVVFFGILIGIIEGWVQGTVESLSSGKHQVIASNHVVVLGYNSKVLEMLRSWSKASEAARPQFGFRPRTTYAILAPENDYTRIMDEIADSMNDGELPHIRLACRVGSPYLADDLHRVSISTAKKVLVAADESAPRKTANRKLLGKLVALRQTVPDFKGEVVAELVDDNEANVVKSVFNRSQVSSVQPVTADILLGRMLVQAIRQPGLASIYNTMMSGDPRFSFHVVKVKDFDPSLVNQKVSEIDRLSKDSSIVCGFVNAEKGGEVDLEITTGNLILKEDSELLVLGDPFRSTSLQLVNVPKNTAKVQLVMHDENHPDALKAIRSRKTVHEVEKHEKSKKQSILMVGWRNDIADMLTELDLTLASGSDVTLIADEDTGLDKNALRSLQLKNSSLRVVTGKPDSIDALEPIFKKRHSEGGRFDHIITLSIANQGQTSIEADSRALASLATFYQLLDDPLNTTVTVQFHNHQFADLAWDNTEEVDNVIMPDTIASRLTSEVVRDPRLNELWKDLFSQYGREIYIRPISRIVSDLSKPYSFKELSEIVQTKNNAILIGYATDTGASINPTGADRNEPRSWTSIDALLIVSDD